MKVIITGSTGMIGKGCLLECMDSPEIDSIVVVNRHPVNISHPKLKEILLKDITSLKQVEESLRGYDACFYCLGITSAGMNEADYTKITFDMTIDFAKEMLRLNPEMVFCYISGAGTDSSERGTSMWARVKGKTENALLSLGFKKAYMFRPGYIQPKRGIKSRTRLYNAVYAVMGPLYFLLKNFPKYVTNTETLARAMIYVAVNGYSKNILESTDINNIGN